MATDSTVETASDCVMRWGLRIPMRDGVQLNGTLYLSSHTARSYVIVTMTPYISQNYHEFGCAFARQGVPFLAVDVRGRGNSEGTFKPFINEASDGHDVVQWVGKQEYCNGRVGLWGGSYSGLLQWNAAKERPSHLGTIVPVASPCLGVDFPMRNNIFSPYVAQWLTAVSGRTMQERPFADQSYWNARFCHFQRTGAPFINLEADCGSLGHVFREWLANPRQAEYWDRQGPTAEEYAAIDVPVLTITGAYDGDQPGALAHYQWHRNHAGQAAEHHYLVIGPWDHAGTRTPRPEVGGVTFGPNSVIDLIELHRKWYAWTLGGGSKPDFLRARVAYYVAVADVWKYVDELPDATAAHRELYLASAQNPSDVFHSGNLSEMPRASSTPDHYVHDPLETQISAVERRLGPARLTDQELILGKCGRQLIYHSAPFEQDTEITGFFRLLAWIGIDQPDCDISVSVSEVLPDGTHVYLSSDAVRARYRESLRREVLVDTTSPLRYEFNRFMFISRRVRAGSRLRLVIGPLHSIFSERNFNCGGPVAEVSSQSARTVTVQVYHGPSRPSCLYVPLGSAQ